MRHDLSHRRASGTGGFSLIELSIVLIVMGLLLIPFIKAYDVYQTQKRLDDTKVNLSFLNTALANFYSEHGRYPCPADRSLGFDDPGHGREQCARPAIPPDVSNPPALELLGPNSCGGLRARGFCSARNSAGDNIYIGAVPYVTLDIQGSGVTGSQTIDGWKNILTYAVSASLTDEATFDPNDGAVDVINEHGTPVGLMHGIIISHGRDGMGAFNVEGVERLCNAGTVQVENCDNDAVFMSSINLYEADGSTYYDDLTFSSDWTQSGIWSYLNGVDIRNTNTGNVGIGTTSPGVKLDVIGDIRSTDRMQTTNFCNEDGTICFPAANIGGAGMQCPGGDDEIAYAIGQNRLYCRTPYAIPANSGCTNPNEYVYRITPSGVQCRPLP